MADTMETTQAPASGDLRQQIEAQLATCRDPEIGLDIMSLGLVYDLDIAEDGNVLIKMTLTAIGCPWAQDLFDEVKLKVEEVPGVKSCTVELVYSPPWSADMMSEEAKMELGFL
jgi:metal-sulfur cluster biosynthetic enzyme